MNFDLGTMCNFITVETGGLYEVGSGKILECILEKCKWDMCDGGSWAWWSA